MKLYQALHQAITARDNCDKSGNLEWSEEWNDKMLKLLESAPSGSGFDAGTSLDHYGNRNLTFKADFHHMDEYGGYCGWTEHFVTVNPEFYGFSITVSGKNKNDIKSYISDVFYHWLDTDVE